MADVVDYLRRFHSSVATGTFGSDETEAAPILRRMDAFLSSHLGGFICYISHPDVLLSCVFNGGC